jgi:type VI secretion system protein ImpH
VTAEVASAAGSALPAHLSGLFTRGQSWQFTHAVRLVEESAPDAVPVGHQGPPAREALRFRAHLSLAFPASDIVEATPEDGADGQRRWTMTVSFLGLYGPASPLPSYFTERLLAQDGRSLTSDFLDLFHHRLVSLLYRAWAKYHPAGSGVEDQRFAARLLHLIGFGDDAHPDLPRELLLSFAGLVGRTGLAPESLAAIIAGYFGVTARAEPCLARWTPIEGEARCALGRRASRLGRDALTGTRVYNRTTAFGLTLGPLSAAELAALAPGGARHGDLRGLVASLNPERLDCQMTLHTAADELPATALGRAPGRFALGHGARIGGRRSAPCTVRFLLPA